MKIFIGADHRGFELKSKLIDWLKSNGYEIEDCGAFEYNKDDDASDFSSEVARKIQDQTESFGIVICGSGAAVDIAANRFRGVRCGLGFEKGQVEHMRGWDHINILALPADNLDYETAKELVETFLKTAPKQEERMLRRVKKLDELS